MAAPDPLVRWIADHKVCWDLAPLTEWGGASLLRVGYELHLYAAHDVGGGSEPGCDRCRELYEKLRTIALAALPAKPGPTTFEIGPFDAAWHLRPEAAWSREVQLTLRIVHRSGYLTPLGPGETRCAKEIQARLRALGAQERTWSETRASRPPS